MTVTTKQARQRLTAKNFHSGQIAALSKLVEDLQTQITNLNTWATTLATKLNTDNTAQNLLNAFPLTLDTNYDTNPQA